jgi:serine/threonine kinase PknH
LINNGSDSAALDAAHAEGLIHRDVKPANIIVTPADFAYLLDFGIAEAKGDPRLTMAGTQIGSFAYMAPERFNDQEPTPAADVYSLACVLYEALTGDTPFRADSVEHLIAAHIASPPRPSAVNPNVPDSFDDVSARGTAKEPDDRYGSAGAIGRAAQRALRADGRASSDTTAPLARQFELPTDRPFRVHLPPGGPPTQPEPTVSQRGAGDRSRQWCLLGRRATHFAPSPSDPYM